ncbi:MAG: type II toxin-antitoxin system PemK/MazF family toxin [Myxococcaceae bacterium]|nr:MAG: type II toxin-antitoxin system PemK/MazF family toxin [Myxococcaceae bacterium]
MGRGAPRGGGWPGGHGGRQAGALGRGAGLGRGVRVKVERGTVVLVELDPTVGHEQRGVRPCVAVSDPVVNADQRFPLIAVVPITGTPGEGALYPELSPGTSGLTKTSFALIDQLRSIDKRRIRRLFGRVTRDELAAVDQGLELFLGLAERP